MKYLITCCLLLVLVTLVGCDGQSAGGYAFDYQGAYSCVPEIPEGDEWLESLVGGLGIDRKNTEIDVWRLTDIEGEGVEAVYARTAGDRQFIVRTNKGSFFVDTMRQLICEAGDEYLSPSGRYIVKFSEQGFDYYTVPLTDVVKRDEFWEQSFSSNVAAWNLKQ